MKKKLLMSLMLLVVATVASWAQKTVPYSSALYGDTEWTIVDNNGDGKKWADFTDTTTGTSYLRYYYSSSNAADDWFVSPGITLEAGKEYKFSVWMYTGYDSESFKIVIGSSNDVATLDALTPLYDNNTKAMTTYKKIPVVFTPETSGTYYYAVKCYSGANRYYVCANNFSVNLNVLVPGNVENLTATPGENEALTVDLAWTAPTVDDDGAALTKAIDKYIISRDGTQIAELDGTVLSFQDNAEKGLTSGKHEYTIKAKIGDAISSGVTIKTSYVGPVVAHTVPYSDDLYQNDEFTVVNNDGDSYTWSDYNDTSYGYGNCKRLYTYSASSGKVDDWLISPKIALKAGKTYKFYMSLRCYTSYGSTYPEAFNIYVNKSKEVSAFTADEPLKSVTDFKESAYKNVAVLFTPTEDGDYYYGLQSQKPSYSSYYLYANHFSVAENSVVAGDVTGLSVAVSDSEVKADLTWAFPTVDGDGFPLTAAIDSFIVYRNDVQVGRVAGTATSFTDTEANGLTVGFHTYKVVTKIGTSYSTGVSIKTSYVGPVATQEIPYSFDFTSESQDNINTYWKFLDANSDGTTWYYYTSSYNGNYVRYDQSYSHTNNDLLVSPKLNLTEGYYKLTLKACNSSYSGGTGRLKVMYGKTASAEGLADSLGVYHMSYAYSASDMSMYIHVPETAEAYIAILADSTNSSTFQVNKFSIAKADIKATPATNLTATAAADQSLKVTVAWTNAAVTNVGTTLDAISKVEVLRGTDVVKEYENATPGAAMTYEDEVPEAGSYKYTVKTYTTAGEAEGTEPSVTTKWVGDPTQTLPYSCDFTTDAKFSLWNVFDANEDGKTWTLYKGYTSYATLLSGTNNDYIIAPPIQLQAGKYYSVSFDATPSTQEYATLGIITDLTKVVDTFDSIQVLNNLANYAATKTTKVIYYSEKDQKAYFAWRYKGTSTYAGKLTSVVIDEQSIVPDIASDLKYTVDGTNVTVTWTNPTKSNVDGVDPGTLTKAVVYCDGTQIAEVTEGLTAGAEASYTHENVAAGAHTYGVEIYNAAGKSESAMPTVLTEWIGDGLTLPYETDFTQNPLTHGWTTFYGASNVNKWYYNSNSEQLEVYKSSGVTDMWAMTPPVEMTHVGKYKVTVESYVYKSLYTETTPADGHFSLYYGPSATDTTTMVKIADQTVTKKTYSKSLAESYECEFSLPTAGKYYVALRSKESGLVYFAYFKVEDETPATSIKDVNAEINADNTPVYNLAGQRIKTAKKGDVIIRNGKKIVF